MRWRRTLVVLHRDIGFLCAGLTLVYAVSGIAVNHKQDWNYNQSTRAERRQVGEPAALLADLPEERRAAIQADVTAISAGEEAELVARLGEALGRAAPPRNAFWRGRDRLSLFYGPGETDVVDYRPSSGVATHVRKLDRPVFREVNFLHLNEGKRLWTWVADVYAGLLAFLALSGIIMVKGRAGLAGRGAIYVAIGVLVPLLGLVLLRWR